MLRFRTGSWNELHIVESSPLGVIVTRFGGRKLLPGRSETAARPVGNCCPAGRELLASGGQLLASGRGLLPGRQRSGPRTVSSGVQAPPNHMHQ